MLNIQLCLGGILTFLEIRKTFYESKVICKLIQLLAFVLNQTFLPLNTNHDTNNKLIHKICLSRNRLVHYLKFKHAQALQTSTGTRRVCVCGTVITILY